MFELVSTCDGRRSEPVSARSLNELGMFVSWWHLLCLTIEPGQMTSMEIRRLEGKQP